MGAGDSRALGEDPGEIVTVGTGRAPAEEVVDPLLQQLLANRSARTRVTPPRPPPAAPGGPTPSAWLASRAQVLPILPAGEVTWRQQMEAELVWPFLVALPARRASALHLRSGPPPAARRPPVPRRGPLSHVFQDIPEAAARAGESLSSASTAWVLHQFKARAGGPHVFQRPR